ncbi:MAG: SDR family NAD(P)-dependent oxidoreductase [Gammaproteobacteria bacterium]
MRFEKLRAVVSGGASGLGRAVTDRVLGADGRVVVLDVAREAGQALMSAAPERVLYVPTDVRVESEVDQALIRAREFLGRIDLAVACAGVIGAGRVLGREGPMPSEHFQRTIGINLIGTFHLVKAAANLMQAQEPNGEGERGVLVLTASVAAFEGQIGQAAYSASKGGVAGMTLPLAREFARLGIRVMTIAPGIFETAMVAGMTDEIRQSLASQIPFPQRLGRPDEYAALVRHIVENSMLNGTTIRLDGAIRMQPK